MRTLEEFLKDFPGCILIVSHDRYFMDVWLIILFAFEGDGVIKDFPGNYSQYREWKEKELQAASDKPQASRAKRSDRSIRSPKRKIKKVLSFKEKHEFEKLEQEMPALQKEKVSS